MKTDIEAQRVLSQILEEYGPRFDMLLIDDTFLMKSKNWNFVECVDCKWMTDCVHCERYYE